MSVQAWEDELRLRTYLPGPEDPLPRWERTGTRRVYPYAMQDDLTDEVRDVPYRALHIENDHLHCIVLPELGGHLYSLYDKIAGREVFYRNNVVKCGLVARRGAWISGGIEFNFPQGHTCVTVSPVASAMAQDAATGAASITVGTTDRVSRMRWSVKLSLAPGEARLRQDVMLHNPTPIRRRHYFWANSAVPAADDLRLVYPATRCRTLGGEQPYPIVNGRDMSLYRNHEVPNDIFALDVTEDFFGCYYEEQDVGLVHWSDHHANVGKKFFTWGTADEGMIWVDLLTDEDGQYVELQSGRFVDQSTFEFLYPYQCAKWTEYWYPLNGMGGWCWANESMAFDLRLDGGEAQIAAMANQDIGQAEVVLDYGGGEFWRSPCHLKAGRSVRLATVLPEPEDPEDELGVALHINGAQAARFEHPPEYIRHPPIELPKPALRSPDDEDVTAEELCQHAIRAEKLTDLDRARQLYAQALEQDVGCSSAHLGIGILDFASGRNYGDLQHLRAAVARDPENDEAWYYLALAALQICEFPMAEQVLWRLMGRTACRTEAATTLAKGPFGHQPQQVLQLLEHVPEGPSVRFLKALAYRQEGRPWGAEEAQWEADDPLDGLLAAERCCRALTQDDQGEADAAFSRLRQVLNDDPELWLEVGFAYTDCARPWEAGVLLESACEVVPAVDGWPMVHYFLAHLPQHYRDEGQLKLAAAADPDYCFPSRLDEWTVLNTAYGKVPSDWKARLYLGNLFASLGRREEALALWEAAARSDDGNAILCRNLGLACHLWEEDHATALVWYDKAIERRPDEYRLYLERDKVLSVSGAGAERRLAALEAAPERWEIAARRVECLVELKRWEAAIELMQAHKFRPWEGARRMHALWTEALVGRAATRREAEDVEAALADYELALTYPRNLGVGRAAYPQEAKVHWLAAEVAAQLGDEEKRVGHLSAAAEERHRRIGEADLYKLRALRALGRKEEADELTERLREAGLGDGRA